MANEKPAVGTAQNTGNPVLDTFVNLQRGRFTNFDEMKMLHQIILELAEREPGGLMRQSEGGHLISAGRGTE